MNIVIIGGMVGTETAAHLATTVKSNDMEMLPRIAGSAGNVNIT